MRELEAEKARVLEHTHELERLNDRMLHEIEARTAADRAQREMQARLEGAERAGSLGVMAAGIAHDFNNYLTSILGYAQLALEEPGVRAEAAEHLRNVTVIARQAAELCSGLLSLAGRAPIAVEPVDLSLTVRGMESLLRTSVKDRGRLCLELADELPLVAGDPSHLRRAIVNLAINAAEASEAPGGTIRVQTGTVECSQADLLRMHCDGPRQPGTYVYVEVADEGVGVPPELLQHVFDPFFSTKMVGRGLGLATVFRIASAHGGAIDVHSELGRGTTVRLLFPRSDAGRPERLVELAPAPARARLEGRVLVVDDDDQVRGLTAEFCRRLGLEVRTADGGPEALAALAAAGARHDAVLLDLSMPGMDGLAVLAEIRRLHAELPVLVLSGYSDRLPRAGDAATCFLAKPFSLEDFTLALRRALERPRAAARS